MLWIFKLQISREQRILIKPMNYCWQLSIHSVDDSYLLTNKISKMLYNPCVNWHKTSRAWSQVHIWQRSYQISINDIFHRKSKANFGFDSRCCQNATEFLYVIALQFPVWQKIERTKKDFVNYWFLNIMYSFSSAFICRLVTLTSIKSRLLL